MAVSIVGALSVTSAGAQGTRATLYMAFGCNVAWGFTDAVMYVVSAAIVNGRSIRMVQRLRETSIRARPGASSPMPCRAPRGQDRPETIDAFRKDLATVSLPRSSLSAREFVGAVGVFAIVVLATFPVVLPFILFQDLPVAMRVSNALALAVLYGYGHLLGSYTGGRAWRYGLSFAALGAGLVAVIMALGG